jgi:hypothetical protein
MSEEEILKAGIAAARAGNMKQAAELFARVVRGNPSSEQGWFLLGMSSATTEQREYCLRRTLAINPNHAEAIKRLSGMAAPSGEAVSSQPAELPLGTGNIKTHSVSYEDISNAGIGISEKSGKRLSSAEVDALVVKEMQGRRRKGTLAEFLLAAGGGCLAIVLLSAFWATYAFISIRSLRPMAWVMAVAVGIIVALINKHGQFSSWILAAVLTLFGCLLGNYLVASAILARALEAPILTVATNLPFEPQLMSIAWTHIAESRKLIYYALAPIISLSTCVSVDQMRDTAFKSR